MSEPDDAARARAKIEGQARRARTETNKATARRTTILLSTVSLLAGTTVGALALLSAINSEGDSQRAGAQVSALINATISANRQAEALKAEIAAATRQSGIHKPGRTEVDLSVIENRIASLEQQQAQINATILTSPEKALTLPLMRRDLDDLKASNTADIAAVRREIDRVYDLNKWLLGGLAVSIVTLALTSLLRGLGNAK